MLGLLAETPLRRFSFFCCRYILLDSIIKLNKQSFRILHSVKLVILDGRVHVIIGVISVDRVLRYSGLEFRSVTGITIVIIIFLIQLNLRARADRVRLHLMRYAWQSCFILFSFFFALRKKRRCIRHGYRFGDFISVLR